jgi:hypothetical protein
MRSPATIAPIIAACTDAASLKSPADIGSLHGWWGVDGTGSLRDTGAGATAPTGVTLKSPGAATGTWAVSQLDDMSGNGRHLVQATTTLQPILDQAALVNGYPPVKFDGTDDYLQTAAFTAIAQPFTVWLVGRKRSATNNVYAFAGSDSTHQANLFTSSLKWATGTTGTFFSGGTVDTVAFDIACVYNGTSGAQYFRNALTSGSDGTQTPAKWTLGARYDPTAYMDLNVYSFAVFTKALSAAEVLQLRNYARTAFAVT